MEGEGGGGNPEDHLRYTMAHEGVCAEDPEVLEKSISERRIDVRKEGAVSMADTTGSVERERLIKSTGFDSAVLSDLGKGLYEGPGG